MQINSINNSMRLSPSYRIANKPHNTEMENKSNPQQQVSFNGFGDIAKRSLSIFDGFASVAAALSILLKDVHVQFVMGAPLEFGSNVAAFVGEHGIQYGIARLVYTAVTQFAKRTKG